MEWGWGRSIGGKAQEEKCGTGQQAGQLKHRAGEGLKERQGTVNIRKLSAHPKGVTNFHSTINLVPQRITNSANTILMSSEVLMEAIMQY